jgi:hypothetical protein
VRLFWLPQRGHVALAALEWILTAFAVAGLRFWVFYPLIYYVLQSDERYRYPIEWSIVLAAAIGIFHFLDQRAA